MTYEEAIQQAVADGLGLPKSPIQNDVFTPALDFANREGRKVFDAWMWQNRELDTVEVSTDTDGIITFDGDNATVDLVKGMRGIDAAGEETGPIYPQTRMEANLQGAEVQAGYFIQLPDDDDGYRRVKVATDDSISTYKCQVTKRYVDAVVDDDYDADDESATPYDYRVLTWPIDKAQNAFLGFLTDALRIWDGNRPTGDGVASLSQAVEKVTKQQGNASQLVPHSPIFDEMGNWW